MNYAISGTRGEDPPCRWILSHSVSYALVYGGSADGVNTDCGSAATRKHGLRSCVILEWRACKATTRTDHKNSMAETSRMAEWQDTKTGGRHATVACSGLVRYSVRSSNSSADHPKRPDGEVVREVGHGRLKVINETFDCSVAIKGAPNTASVFLRSRKGVVL